MTQPVLIKLAPFASRVKSALSVVMAHIWDEVLSFVGPMPTEPLGRIPGARKPRAAKSNATAAERVYLEKLNELAEVEEAEAILVAQMELDATQAKELVGLKRLRDEKLRETLAPTDDIMAQCDRLGELREITEAMEAKAHYLKRARVREVASMKAEALGLMQLRKRKADEKREAEARKAKEDEVKRKADAKRKKNREKMARKRANRMKTAEGRERQKQQHDRWNKNKKEKKQWLKDECAKQLAKIQGEARGSREC